MMSELKPRLEFEKWYSKNKGDVKKLKFNTIKSVAYAGYLGAWNTRPNDAKIEALAVKVADGSVLIPNIIMLWAKVKKEGLDPSMYGTGSYEGDCKIIDEQRQFFDDLYLLLSKIIDIDPDLLPEQSSEGEEG